MARTNGYEVGKLLIAFHEYQTDYHQLDIYQEFHNIAAFSFN